MNLKSLFLVVLLSLLLATMASAQVLGPCGGGAKAAPATAQTQEPASALKVQPLPLPGQQAIDFELTAVVGDQVKNIKLSDYNGKWRVLCFFPAAFTFV